MANIRNSISVVDQMTPTLRSILKAMDSTLRVMKNLDRAANSGIQSKAYQRAEADIKRANNQLIKMRNHALLAADGADSVADAWNKVDRSVNKSKGGFASMFKTAASGIYTVKSGIQAITKMMGTVDGTVSDIAKLSLFNTSGQSDLAVYGEVYKTAQDSRSGLSETAGLAQRIMLSDVYQGPGATESAIDLAGTINKAMVLGGGTQEENSRTILQLSQALSSGALQGDELRSLREQSPYLAKMLAEGLANVDDKFIGTTVGDLKSLGAQGELTSEVVVKALQSMKGEISETFDEKAPKTFSGAMQSVSNTVRFFISVLSSAEGPLGRINEALWDVADWLGTTEGFEALSYLAPVLNVVAFAAEGLAWAVMFVGNNMGWIAPILGTVLALILAYNTYLAISKAITFASGIAQGIAAVAAYKRAKAEHKAALAAAAGTAANTTLAASLTAESMAAASAKAAQHGLNAALYACPLTWIIVLLIVLIGIVFLVVGIINKATGSTVSAFGVILGALLFLVAAIWNTVVGVIDGILQLFWSIFVTPFIGIIEFILNAVNGGFNDFGGAVANLLGQIISWFLDLGKVVTKIIDAIFGTNWTDGLNDLQDKVLAWGKNDDAITISREAPSLEDLGAGRWEYSDAYNTGYDLGKGIEDKLGNFGNFDDLMAGLEPLDTTISGGKLDGIGDDVNISDEDIKLLREMAARDYLLQLQTITPVANVTFGDVRETADVHKIVEVIETMVEEQMATALVS